MRFAIALTWFATGCFLGSEPPDGTEPYEEPDGPDPGPPSPSPPVIIDCSGGGDCSSPPIAVGGLGRLTAAHAHVASGPFTWLGAHHVRADAAGRGTLVAGGHTIPISSRPISAVRLGPVFTRAPRFNSVLDGEHPFPEDLPGIHRPLVLHTSDPHGVVRLWSTEFDEPTYGAERLVDTSLRIASADPGVTLTSWDVISVPPVAGVYQVALAADSFGSFPLEITVVDHVDHLDAKVFYTPRKADDLGLVCFHARTELGQEIAFDLPSIQLTGPAEATGSPGRNCRTFEATGPGTISVTTTPAA